MSGIATVQPPIHNASQVTLPGDSCDSESTKIKCPLPSPAPSHSVAPLEQSPRCPRSFSNLFPQVAPVLENSGTAARDHLSNERTWLAYVRTSLAISGAGVALVQLFTIPTKHDRPTVSRLARPLGAITVALGLIILGIGVRRFFKVQKAIIRGFFPTARGSTVLITAALAALVAMTFGILIALPL